MSKVLDKAVAGERLSRDEGLRLIESHDLVALGQAADAVTRRLHPEPYRTYNIDRNINYTIFIRWPFIMEGMLCGLLGA
ncbi:MAG: hypothetical protein WD403_12500, partial [Pirellulales bacterium]